MDIHFEDVEVACLPGTPLSGRAEFEYDADMEMIFAETIYLAATATLPALELTRNMAGTRRKLFHELEDKLMATRCDELDELIPSPRFDPRQEWGTYIHRRP